MGVNLFKIFEPPRKGAVVGGVVARGMAAVAATRRAPTPRRRKNRHPFWGGGWGCGD